MANFIANNEIRHRKTFMSMTTVIIHSMGTSSELNQMVQSGRYSISEVFPCGKWALVYLVDQWKTHMWPKDIPLPVEVQVEREKLHEERKMAEKRECVSHNDQVNPDAAKGVPCENANSAARVERIVRPFLSGPYVKQTEADKLTAFETVFGLTPDKINGDVDVYFNVSVPSLNMAHTLKALGFSVGLINRWPDGELVFEEV